MVAAEHKNIPSLCKGTVMKIGYKVLNEKSGERAGHEKK